jgi:hypothetical protein
MIAKIKNHWHFDDAYQFIQSNEKYAQIFGEEYPPDEGEGEDPDLFDRVLAHCEDEGDQSVIESILEKVDGNYFVTFHQTHPSDDGMYTVYEFE